MSEPFDYDPQTWVNGVGGGTKINATRLAHLETGVDEAAAAAAEALAAAEPVAALQADLAAATELPTEATLARRDGNGRLRVAAPAIGADVVNKTTMDTAITGAKDRATHTGTQDIATVTGVVPADQLGTGTPASGQYVDGATGAWTALPTIPDVSGFVTGTGITAVVAISQAAYDALVTPDSTTLYVISA